jgi:hypothetical protein
MTGPLRALRHAAAATAVLSLATLVSSPPADARVFFGFGLGVPLGVPYYFGPPPVYYPPPPVIYAPPPVYYTPPPQAYAPQGYAPAPNLGQSAARQSCYAGPYMCPMDRPVQPGATCWCPGNGGQRIYGQAN